MPNHHLYLCGVMSREQNTHISNDIKMISLKELFTVYGAHLMTIMCEGSWLMFDVKSVINTAV